MPAEFNSCVRKVMGQGKNKSDAFDICTAQFKRAGKLTPILLKAIQELSDKNDELIDRMEVLEKQ